MTTYQPELRLPGMLRLVFFILMLWCCFCPASEVSVLFWNTENYFIESGRGGPVKGSAEKDAIAATIRHASPDIILLTEINGPAALDDFRLHLESAGLEYPESHLMCGADKSRWLAMLSRVKPRKITVKDDLLYKIRPKKGDLPPEPLAVQRGFQHLEFQVDDYSFHLINCHLKSKVFHYRYNQTDMRRYEARLLRYYVNHLINLDPGINLIVMGDFNDIYSAETLRTVRGDGKAFEEVLYDLRPADQLGFFWTHWWHAHDSYGRIDYAFASYGILPEIMLNELKLVHLPVFWDHASDHRPLFVKIRAGEADLWGEEKIRRIFPDNIRRNPDEVLP